ncbi:hypothetical protein DIPPA_31810 [Diplonema papillatum]|nr:hypothetical protein DIPPA_31810 [Diplonema papillatum]
MLNTTLRALFFIEDTDEKEMDDATAEEVIDLFTSGFAAEALRAAWFAGESEPVEKVAKKRKIDLTLP